ncbi:hypothetical protein, partial [Streptomyces sp. MBT59]|uniref:hypothetical protein n=1 Tax=Streptomyces sp. MBT59 TaxID=1488390 RepID=UPI001F204FB7
MLLSTAAVFHARAFFFSKQNTASALRLSLVGSGWRKVEATYTLAAGQSVDRVGVACYGATGTVWWADAAQVVVGDGPTGTYADGTFSGYHWAGEPYASPTVPDSWEPEWQTVSVLDQKAPANAVWSVVQVGTSGNTTTPYVL